MQAHFKQRNAFPIVSSSHSGHGRNGLVEGKRVEKENQYDPADDDEFLVGEGKSEEEL